jgi:beta-glucanase (GH16 family)
MRSGDTLRIAVRRSRGFRIAAVSIVAVVIGLLCPACSSAPGSAGQWTKVWTDSFNGPAGSQPDSRYWGYNRGMGVFGTGEVETMTSSPGNIHLDGHGNLDITVVQNGFAWTSSRIQTHSSRFAAPVGGQMKVTASIRQPAPANGLGYWPGFWMLGPAPWPATGEIDIMEVVNGLSATGGSLHCGNLTQRNPDGSFGPCHEGKGIGSGLQPCPGCQTAYNSYSVIVDRRNAGHEQIRWYLNGRQVFALNESQVGRSAWAKAVDHGFSIIFDVAVGGSYPDTQCQCQTPTSQTSPGATMTVRYVTVSTARG